MEIVQRGAVPSGLGFPTFQISILMNVLNTKQFEDHVHILLRWMTSKFSPTSSSFLLVYSPFLLHWSIFIISPNFFLCLISFPKYFCFWLSYKSINLLPQCAITRDNMSIMFTRRQDLINLGIFLSSLKIMEVYKIV